MSKIEKRHDDELRAILEDSSLQKLEEIYSNLPKDAPTDTPEKLDKLDEKIKQASEFTITALESLELKIDKNYERKLRYHHVVSLNFKVGKTKSNEFGSFIASQIDTPEEALLKKEQMSEIYGTLDELKPELRTIFTTYIELGYSPEHENISALLRALEPKGITKTDKTLKKDIRNIQKHFSELYPDWEI